jgi:signal transduction histidine kinase
MSRMAPEIAAAYQDADRVIAIRRIRIGCVLAMLLLPLGYFIDIILYQKEAPTFLNYRLAGSLAMAPLLALVLHPLGQRHHRTIGVILAMIPAACMAWIIAHTPDTARSPYYAGLNLVLLAVGLVLQWTTIQSASAVAGVVFLYAAACADYVTSENQVAFYNNLYFIVITGLIVILGNSIQTGLRQSDFAARFQLEQSRRELETANSKLALTNTQLESANSKLGEANAQLESTNEKLAQSNRRLRELDEIKGRFFANISHELRTPLTLLLAPLEQLRNAETLEKSERTVDLLDTMFGNGMRLLKLINDLLDLVRLDAGALQLQKTPISVNVFLGGILHSVRSLAEGKGIHLAHHVSPEVQGVLADPDKLEKVFLNLFFNALKFTPAGGRVEARATIEDDRVVFTVTDTGVGIPDDKLPFVFDRFWQGDTSAQRKYQGAGIGLAIVKELVEAHGGSVQVQSRRGTGTSMIVRLPAVALPPDALIAAAVPETPVVAASQETSAATTRDSDTQLWLATLYKRAELYAGIPNLRETMRPLPAQGQSKNPRLLIAEDEPDMLGFLRLSLRDDYELVEAVDGEQAVTLATQYLPDVILCDMMMPEKDGLQVCQEIRRQRSTRTIPFLMLTARADDETKLTALNAGASDYLSKPFSTAELRLRIKNLVDAHRLQKALSWQNQKLEATLEQLQETETQLVQAEKLASLGRLSAGIIHEINNPLNFAKTGLHMLAVHSRALPESARADFQETINDIGDGLSRVVTIVSDLRTFTHPGSAEDDVDIAPAISTAARFLAAEFRDDIQFVCDIPDGITVRGNRNRLIQVFVNLLQNAVDAVHSKKYVNGESPEIRAILSDTPSIRRIHIRDNGSGIPAEVASRIFDPFFTTKDVGRGTGLGLSICHRIIADCGGRISVRSEPGRFSEFTLEFPLSAPEPQPSASQLAPPPNG